MAQQPVSILQPPRPFGIFDKITGAILPLADRFIEFEEIRRTTGRELNAAPITGIADDPDPDRVFTDANVGNQRQQAAQQILSVVPLLVVGGIVVIGGLAIAKIVSKR